MLQGLVTLQTHDFVLSLCVTLWWFPWARGGAGRESPCC